MIDNLVRDIKYYIESHNEYHVGDFGYHKNRNNYTLKLCKNVIIKVTYSAKKIRFEIPFRYLQFFQVEGFNIDKSIISASRGWAQIDLTNQSTKAILLGIEDVYFDCMRRSAPDSFGCCNRFVECSDKKACTQPDKILSRGCMYKDNLRKGLIFYGVNQNIRDL